MGSEYTHKTMKLFVILQVFLGLSAWAETHLLIKTRSPIQNASFLAGSTNWQSLRVSDAEKKSIMEALKRNPEVEWVEEDQRYFVDQSGGPIHPSDTLFDQQWSIQKMGIPEAWKLVPENAKEVLVAVVDTGTSLQHPDLMKQIFQNPKEIAGNEKDDDQNGFIDDVMGWNFEGKDSNAEDDFNHGSHVSGIIGATQNNGLGISGISPKVKILPVRWMKNGSGYGEDAIAAIHYAVKMGARVINASWGGIGYSKALEEAVREAESQGVLFVASAGNGHSNNDEKPRHPANLRFSNVISVASVDENDHLEKYSNFGAKMVELAAPGKEIVSTMMNRQYGAMSGTSMAAAEVSGVAALLLTINPKLTGQDIKRILMQTVQPVPELQGKTISGGRVDALRAAHLVMNEMRLGKMGTLLNDSDLSPPLAQKLILKSGNLLKPDRVEDGAEKTGLSLRFVRIVKGIETPIEGISFKAQIHADGGYQTLKSNEKGEMVDSACNKPRLSVTAVLESDRYQVTPGSAPYELLLTVKCGVEQKIIFDEKSESGQALGIWQIAVKAEHRLAAEVGLQFWKRQIAFEWPATADYYNGDRVHNTLGNQWDVVSHEMGHAIYDQANLGVFGGGQHYIDQCYSEAMALSEGWASFYAGWLNLELSDPDAKFEYMVPRRAPIRFENIPSDVCGKSTNEWRVIGFLWDLIDTHDDGETQSQAFSRLWADTFGARASSASKMKSLLLQKGWDRDRVETIWKLNFPNE